MIFFQTRHWEEFVSKHQLLQETHATERMGFFNKNVVCFNVVISVSCVPDS